MDQNNFFQTLTEILNRANKTNEDELEKIAGQLHSLNETVNECFEALHDLYISEKEKTAAIKQIASWIHEGGLAHDICGGIRHGLFGQHAQSDASLYDFVNVLNVPLSELVNAVHSLVEVQSYKGNRDEETGK